MGNQSHKEGCEEGREESHEGESNESHESHEGHEKEGEEGEDCGYRQDGICVGSARITCGDCRWSCGIRSHEEQGRQDCQQEEKCIGQEESMDDGLWQSAKPWVLRGLL